MASKGKIPALAYMRTSSQTNVGSDKDSEKRQRAAIEGYAKRAGYKIEEWFYDPGVSGTDPLEARPGFNAMLDRIEGNGVRVVLIEDASRFARSTLVQELGILSLIERNVRVITSTGDELTDDRDEMKVFIRQIAAAFAQLERTRLVSKLAVARQRKRDTAGKCEGRKAYREMEHGEDLIKTARGLNDGRPLLKISAALAERGYRTRYGKPYSASAVKAILAGEPLKSRRAKSTSRGKRILVPAASACE
jgi:DNA invertase Pin-like site-specific DNA recombinase